MKTLTVSLMVIVVMLFSFTSVVHADSVRIHALHEMNILMRFMHHGLAVSLEGANLQMLGQMGQSDKLDRDSIEHGTAMVNDGKAIIKEMLEGKAMRELYEEKYFDKQLMDDIHKLGDKMLEVIALVQNIRERSITQASSYKK